ncbi:histidine kinase N-terminal domain-containing protein [Anaerosinus gibii]|uniref:histidine kinase n=1 Tax=Selenobaculum gibii TaxID=3054208 RepID=A0A9Y2ESZ0_9FIRM|nr:histidine kinase N-terminal domain-containing protein [Selenobaculum gbiensis]WIW71508.1 histidine kinase N-terminal domain-containing protein [Selenobaculum gbiensis]
MNSIIDMCHMMTTLSVVQMDILDKLHSVYPIVADIAHAQLTVYVKSSEVKNLLVISQIKPNTNFSQYRANNKLESQVRIAEEPLVWHTLSTGETLQGKREWAWGLMMDMYTYPIYDYYGKIIACVSFETNWKDLKIKGYNYLLETAYAIISNASFPIDYELYRSLSASDGIVITDKHSKITFANTAARSIYKVLGVGEMVGHHMFDREITMHIKKETTLVQRPHEKELEIGNLVLIQRSIPIYENQRLFRTVIIVSDVTELKKKEKELIIKSAVIQEIHHRVKNNLQTIASLLRLQSRRTNSPEVKAALKESVNRILSISVVHEFLSQQDAEIIDVVEVAKNILDLVMQNMLEPDFKLETKFKGETIILPSEHASSLALVMNELIQNSIEHGFIGCNEGVIGLNIVRESDNYLIDLYDNGTGLPETFQKHASKSLGLQIVRTLIEDDLGGTFELYSDKGTHARINIPRKMGGGR